MKEAFITVVIFSVLLLLLQISNINATVTFQNDNSMQVAVCSEQLQICINEYNSLYYDMKNGTNCNSETFNQLKKKNNDLSYDREMYKQQVEDLKNYKPGFFVMSTLLIIWIILFLIPYDFKNKLRRLKNGRKIRSNRKEKDS